MTDSLGPILPKDNHLEAWLRGKHVWLADHYSVPAEQLCMKRAPSPNADMFCVREVNHRGICTLTADLDYRDRSWKDVRDDGQAS